jgi:transposase
VLTPDLCPVAGLRLDDLILTPNAAVALLVSTAASAPCPRCGALSDSVHSRYRRTVADLPCHGRPVALRLVVRRFRCAAPGCPRAIFCERLPALLNAHARATARLTDAHRALGFALGGEAGSRLAEHLDMPTSPDTLLRRVKESPDEPAPPPRYVGVDDWAVRKGQRYGTILVDLERGRVIDLLPGRDGVALGAWLRDHPGVEVITRDRWAAYAQAAAEAAPQAMQVADRWHLLKNLREAVERLLARMTGAVRGALGEPRAAGGAEAQGACEPTVGGPPAPAGPTPPAEATPPTGPAESPREQARLAKRQARAEAHRKVRELRARGLSLRRVARALGLSVKRVIRYARAERVPDWNPGRRGPTQLDPFAAHVDAWVSAGGRNAADLYRELAAQGCRAGYDAVRRYLARRVGSTGRPGPRVGPLTPPPPPPPPSARRLSFEFIRRPEDREADEQACVDRLRAADPVLREGLDLAAGFAAMVRKAATTSLADWLAAAEGAGCAEMRSFAAGLRQDEAAVRAALTEPWSNGPTEGHVNRLKLIKRSMFGRAGFKMLRARVVNAA